MRKDNTKKKVNHDDFVSCMVWRPSWIFRIFTSRKSAPPLKNISSEDISSRMLSLTHIVAEMSLIIGSFWNLKILNTFCRVPIVIVVIFSQNHFGPFLKGDNSKCYASNSLIFSWMLICNICYISQQKHCSYKVTSGYSMTSKMENISQDFF